MKEMKRPDFSIYRNGVYAKSKIGNGYDLSEEFLMKLHKIMSKGMDELVYGLSKCYFPRHGIIYFDENNEPVCSFSICIECHKLGFWSKNDMPPFEDDYEKFNYKKAEGQMEMFEALFKKYKIPVFDQNDEYVTFAKKDSSTKMNGSMTITDPNLNDNSLFAFTKKDVKNWVIEGSEINLKDDVDTKYTAGGDEYNFPILRDDQGLIRFMFDFDETQSNLTEAVIASPGIRLPNGLSVGMSLDQVKDIFGVYDGLSAPELIIHEGEKVKFEYHFSKMTLTKIVLVIQNY